MTTFYLDSSIALHAVLPGGNRAARKWIDADTNIASSTLLELETARVLKRERLPLALAGPLLDRIALASIDDSVLRVAAAIEPHVKSLDAIHLATATLLASDVVMATHDHGMQAAADQLGMRWFDPLGR